MVDEAPVLATIDDPGTDEEMIPGLDRARITGRGERDEQGG
jgi:hypothetical protein